MCDRVIPDPSGSGSGHGRHQVVSDRWKKVQGVSNFNKKKLETDEQIYRHIWTYSLLYLSTLGYHVLKTISGFFSRTSHFLRTRLSSFFLVLPQSKKKITRQKTRAKISKDFCIGWIFEETWVFSEYLYMMSLCININTVQFWFPVSLANALFIVYASMVKTWIQIFSYFLHHGFMRLDTTSKACKVTVCECIVCYYKLHNNWNKREIERKTVKSVENSGKQRIPPKLYATNWIQNLIFRIKLKKFLKSDSLLSRSEVSAPTTHKI